MTIAILIPTLNRPDQAAAVVDNVHDVTESPHRVYCIVEKTDAATQGALKNKDCVVVRGDFGSCARAMNEGYRVSTEPYVFTGNDDLKFHTGWDRALLAVNKPIVGINQGDGKTTCFTLVERSYIEEHSGVYDKPKILYHEYGSQFCDTEFADYAKGRGVWGEVTEPLVEHLHHTFGKAEVDETYRKTSKTFEEDKTTYDRRRQEIVERNGSWKE